MGRKMIKWYGESQAGTGCESVAHGDVYIWDSGALVLKSQAAASLGTVQDFDPHIGATTVDHSITRQFTRGGDELGLIDKRESELSCNLTYSPTHDHNVRTAVILKQCLGVSRRFPYVHPRVSRSNAGLPRHSRLARHIHAECAVPRHQKSRL